MRRRHLKAPLFLCLLACVPWFAWGQSFERNKVQYDSIDFSVLKTEHFQVFHYPRGSPAVTDAARILESAYAHHADIFGYGIKGLQKVVLYNSFVDFEQTNVIPGIVSLGEGGVTESLGHRIVLPLTGTYSENAHVLAHELVHAFQFEKLSPLGAFGAGSRPLPLWFIEGQAEYLSLGPDDPLTDMWMRDAVLNNDIPSIDDLAKKQFKYFPYRFGDAVWYWLDRGWGKTGMRAFFLDATEKGIPDAVASALDVKTMEEFSTHWKSDFSMTYAPKIAGRTLPRDVGTTLPGLDSGLNLSPVISPDGKYIAVFSRRDLFGLDLYLVDAQSGHGAEKPRQIGQRRAVRRSELHRLSGSLGAGFTFLCVHRGAGGTECRCHCRGALRKDGEDHSARKGKGCGRTGLVARRLPDRPFGDQ